MTYQTWLTIDTGPASAKENMAIDARLLEGLSTGGQQPILHLYDWDNPSATYGHFITPHNFLQTKALEDGIVQFARRPTGGGIIFHLADVAFSVLVPIQHPAYSDNVMENYAFVNRMAGEAIQLFTNGKAAPALLPEEPVTAEAQARHFCMAKPTKYDLMLNGRKVGGAAQRRTKHGFLHQGSISLAFPDETLLRQLLLPETTILEAMKTHTCTLLEGPASPQQLAEAQRNLRNFLVKVITQ